MKTLRTLLIGTAVLALIAGSPVAAMAQTAANSGQIVGQLVDASGAAIVGAEITVHSDATNLTRRATSDAAGRFAVPLLPARLLHRDRDRNRPDPGNRHGGA